MSTDFEQNRITKLLSEGWGYWVSDDESRQNLRKAEEKFRLAASLDETGRSQFLLTKLLFGEKRKEEGKKFLQDSMSKGFVPATIFHATVLCHEHGFGKLSRNLLDELQHAAEQGYIKAELLWLSNDKSVSFVRMLLRSRRVIKLRFELKSRMKRDGWLDPLLWG